jgi:hypothetical protein
MGDGSYTQMSARDPMPIMKANRNLIKGEAELIALALLGRQSAVIEQTEIGHYASDVF